MCILSLATLSLDIRKDIPNVYYGTALDWFIIMFKKLENHAI